MAGQVDTRSPRDVMRQWERLKTVKNELIKMGMANGNTSPAECLEILRKQLPPEVFGEPSRTIPDGT